MPPKKAKLTPEERKALRKEKKAQKKLAKIEKKKQLKRDALCREIKYSELTIKDHEKEWKKLLVNIALPEMRSDLEFAWHNFERVIDCKDFTISLLMDDLREAEDHYMLNSKNHIEHIDKLIDMFEERMEELKAENDRQILKLIQVSENEKEQITVDFDEEEATLKTMLYLLEMAKKDQKSNVRAEYFTKLDEEENKNAQLIQQLRTILEVGQATLQQNIKDFLNTYRQQVRERKNEHDILRSRDRNMQKLLYRQLLQLHYGHKMVITLKQNLLNSQKILGRKLKDLESEYGFFFHAFDLLKDRLVIDQQIDEDLLTSLTCNYNSTIEHLGKIKAKGEQILHMAAICRKLETLEEKILPFPVYYKDANIDPLANLSYGNNCLPVLDMFWQRVGQVDASRYAAYEELEFLTVEKDLLMMKIHKYCHYIQCPKVHQKIRIDVRHVTEGAFEYKKYQKQQVEGFVGKQHFLDEEEVEIVKKNDSKSDNQSD